MRPSSVFDARNREIVRQLASRYNVSNPRVFGSVLHGTDSELSDLDLLVDPMPETTLFDLGGLQEELSEVLGVRVDVRTPGDLPAKFRSSVVAEARPL